MLIAEVREHVRLACGRESNLFGAAFFDEHVAVVADCAARLAPHLDADPEAVQLAAWLHDLAAICDPAALPCHARAGAELAAGILTARGCPSRTVDRVAQAIASHSAPVPLDAGSPEAVCLSHADAVSRILRPAWWLYFAFAIRKQPYPQGREWLRSLIETQWRLLIDPARNLAAARYTETLRFLN